MKGGHNAVMQHVGLAQPQSGSIVPEALLLAAPQTAIDRSASLAVALAEPLAVIRFESTPSSPHLRQLKISLSGLPDRRHRRYIYQRLDESPVLSDRCDGHAPAALCTYRLYPIPRPDQYIHPSIHRFIHPLVHSISQCSQHVCIHLILSDTSRRW